MTIMFITGAGLSAPSGIPTYRNEDNSFYNDKELMKLMFKESLQDEEQRANLKQRLEDWKNLLQDKQPNEAHHLITGILKEHDGIVCTQNVDDLHEKTGLDDNLIYHMHGSLFKGCREDYPDILDVVLFGDSLKLTTHSQYLAMERADTIVLVGTSLTTLSPFFFIQEDRHIVIIDKNVSVILENMKSYYGDVFEQLNITLYEGDVLNGLQSFYSSLQNS